MSILDNAINSITLGIEDYQNSDQRRLVSCTRNLFAGILLLFKHKLAKISPPDSDEVLIKQKVLPVVSNGQIAWQGEGRKTVDVQQIKERFESLGIQVEWKRVDKINSYRNDVEHYYSSLSHSAVRGLIADCFVVIRDFVRDVLEIDPLELFDATVWSTFTQVSEVFQKEKEKCLEHMGSIDWKYPILEAALRECSCPTCGSNLIDTNPNCSRRDQASFTCLSCADTFDLQKMADRAVREYLADSNYRRLKDGGDPRTIDCPDCDSQTYLLDEDICLVCENSAPRVCDWCGSDIPSEEIDGESTCGYCSHMMSKDD